MSLIDHAHTKHCWICDSLFYVKGQLSASALEKESVKWAGSMGVHDTATGKTQRDSGGKPGSPGPKQWI